MFPPLTEDEIAALESELWHSTRIVYFSNQKKMKLALDTMAEKKEDILRISLILLAAGNKGLKDLNDTLTLIMESKDII